MRRARRVAPPTAGELRRRLERLRELLEWLVLHAELGESLRRDCAALGVPAWAPAEDLSFRTWIEEHGSEEARDLLAALDAALDRRIAEIEAREAAAEDEVEPS